VFDPQKRHLFCSWTPLSVDETPFCPFVVMREACVVVKGPSISKGVIVVMYEETRSGHV
jgi:hypothetical protein